MINSVCEDSKEESFEMVNWCSMYNVNISRDGFGDRVLIGKWQEDRLTLDWINPMSVNSDDDENILRVLNEEIQAIDRLIAIRQKKLRKVERNTEVLIQGYREKVNTKLHTIGKIWIWFGIQMIQFPSRKIENL